MIAVISDIHANLEAFLAVLDDIEKRKIKRIICLGDVVGYGPDPEACLRLASKRCEQVIMGNHEFALVNDPLGFNRHARQSINWTKRQLRPGLVMGRGRRSIWNWQKNLPDKILEGEMFFVHGSPRNPIDEYVEESDVMDVGFGPGEKVTGLFELFKGVCFVGHTHRPGIIDCKFRFRSPDRLDNSWNLLNGQAIINVGSIGQPRDGDPRACYVTVCGNDVSYHRVEYDNSATVEKIKRISSADAPFAERLLEGR